MGEKKVQKNLHTHTISIWMNLLMECKIAINVQQFSNKIDQPNETMLEDWAKEEKKQICSKIGMQNYRPDFHS